jgi:uncharacterized membrane protein HdeD (DUF308 family)
MEILSFIFGILLIIGGVSCMFTPLATFLSTGYYIAFILLLFGVSGLIRAFQKKAGTMEIIISVLALIAGIFAILRPGNILLFDAMAIYCVAAWYLLQGIASVLISFQVKDTNKNWIWGLIVGILGILLGLYSFAHPGITAITSGMLIGFYFIQAGVDMIAISLVAEDKN